MNYCATIAKIDADIQKKYIQPKQESLQIIHGYEKTCAVDFANNGLVDVMRLNFGKYSGSLERKVIFLFIKHLINDNILFIDRDYIILTNENSRKLSKTTHRNKKIEQFLIRNKFAFKKRSPNDKKNTWASICQLYLICLKANFVFLTDVADILDGIITRPYDNIDKRRIGQLY
jgi:hypothetical protein